MLIKSANGIFLVDGYKLSLYLGAGENFGKQGQWQLGSGFHICKKQKQYLTGKP